MSIKIEDLIKLNTMQISDELSFDHSSFLTGTHPVTQLQKIKVYQKAEMGLNICTLGHVDNGKTTMTSALSGSSVTNIDRSMEERERGITINTTVVQYKRAFLFKKSDLPVNVIGRIEKIESGLEVLCADGIVYMNQDGLYNAVPVSDNVLDLDKEEYVLIHATFVQADAPGHRDFLKNAIKGMASADVILLIVGSHYESLADQRQTLEHLFLLRKFGISVAVFFNQIDFYFPDAIKQAVGLKGEGSNALIDSIISSEDEMATLNLSGLFGEIKSSLGEIAGPLGRLPHETSKLVGVVGASALLASKFDKSRPLGARQCTAQMQHALNGLLKQILTHASHSITRDAEKPFCLNIEGAPKVGRGIVYTGTVMCGKVKVGDEVTIHTKKDKVEGTITSMQQFHKDQQVSIAGDNIAMLIRPTADTAKYMDQVGPHCVVVAKNASYAPVRELVCRMYFYGTELGGRAKENIIKVGYSGTIFIKSGNYNYAVCVKAAYPMYEVNSKWEKQRAGLLAVNAAEETEKKNPYQTAMIPGDKDGYIVVLQAISQDMILPIQKEQGFITKADLPSNIFGEKVKTKKGATAGAAANANAKPAFLNLVDKNWNKLFDEHDAPKNLLSLVFMESDCSVGSAVILSAIFK